MTEQNTPNGSARPPAGRRPRTPWVIAGVAVLILAALVYAFITTTGAATDSGPVIRLGQPALQLGAVAPALNVKTRDGVKVDSEVLRNNIVVVNFFASWCKPCQDEAADLEAVWKDYRPRGVVFLGLTYQDVDAKVAEFVQRNGISYFVADDDGSLANAFGLTGVPETYVIGRDGKLAFKQIGPITATAMRSELDKLLP